MYILKNDIFLKDRGKEINEKWHLYNKDKPFEGDERLPMPIKALFWTGIRFSGVKIPCVHLLIMSRKTSSW